MTHETNDAEVGRLKAIIVSLLRGRRNLNEVLFNQITAMQAAVVAWVHLRPGSDAKPAMSWIINTLRGPGLLPDMDSALAQRGAQAWFDEHTQAEAQRVASLPPDAELPEPATIRELAAAAAHLAHLARESGYVLRITQESRTPLAQGNHFDRVQVYKSTERRRAEEAAERDASAMQPGATA